MSNLSIGLVTSPSEECKQMAQLLEDAGLEICYHISPDQIQTQHIEDSKLNVWLLSVNDDDWHDNIDQLLDESDASIYFNEPGTLDKQSHPEYWCQSLISRLYEITGIKEVEATESAIEQASETTRPEPSETQTEQPSDTELSAQLISQPIEELGSALDELESSSMGLPSDVAADLVSDLENISPELETELSQEPDEFDLSSPDETSKIETETDFLAELVAEKNQVSDQNSNSVSEFDDIDFSSTHMPVLESAKGGINEALKSNYEISDDSTAEAQEGVEQDSEESNLDQGLDEEFELSVGLEPEGDVASDNTDSADDESSGLALEMLADANEEQADDPEQSFERANFLDEDDSSTDINDNLGDTPSDESPDLMGLALESIEPEAIEPEVITGKSNFIEQEDEEVSIPELDEPVDEGLQGLTLESNEVDAPTGKAVFFEEETDETESDETENNSSSQLNRQVENDDSGLSLESNGSETPTGRAVFDDAEAGEQIQQSEPKPEPRDQFEHLDDGGLTLESDGKLATDGSAQYQVDDPHEDDSQQPTEQLAQAEKPTEQTVNSPIITEAVPVGEEEVEIPMLEDSVTNLDFDEPEVLHQEEELTPCWVIGASLGGPAAVKRFFQALPADINASFVVVQHIEESFLPVMAEILASNSQFEVEIANGSNTITAGKIYLAPLKGKIVFLQDGSMLVDHSQKWSEPYAPCINDVIGSLASIYGDRSGSIIFSGMGEDGLTGCEKMSAAGGAVWAQSVETCANPSMPNAVINANLASLVATPEMLADRLAKTLSEIAYG